MACFAFPVSWYWIESSRRSSRSEPKAFGTIPAAPRAEPLGEVLGASVALALGLLASESPPLQAALLLGLLSSCLSLSLSIFKRGQPGKRLRAASARVPDNLPDRVALFRQADSFDGPDGLMGLDSGTNSEAHRFLSGEYARVCASRLLETQRIGLGAGTLETRFVVRGPGAGGAGGYDLSCAFGSPWPPIWVGREARTQQVRLALGVGAPWGFAPPRLLAAVLLR
jgi:hypothetical protein